MSVYFEPVNRTEIEKDENTKKELRYIGTIRRPYKNHRLWEFNYETGELLEVEMKTEMVYSEGKPVKKNKVERRPDCIYFFALNEKSAIRKLFKQRLITSTKKLDAPKNRDKTS